MFPLQFGVPGGPELLVILLVLVIPLALAYYVYTDARDRGVESPALWAVVVFVLTLFTFVGGLVAFVVYLFKRPDRI